MASWVNMGSVPHLQGQSMPLSCLSAQAPHVKRICLPSPSSLRNSLLEAPHGDNRHRFKHYLFASKSCSFQKGTSEFELRAPLRGGAPSKRACWHTGRVAAVLANPPELGSSKETVQTTHSVDKLLQTWQRWWRIPYVEKKESEREKDNQATKSIFSLTKKLWEISRPPGALLLIAVVFLVLSLAESVEAI
jgi:hypothetical protein